MFSFLYNCVYFVVVTFKDEDSKTCCPSPGVRSTEGCF